MSRKATDSVTTIGIDIGKKNTFHLIGLNPERSIVPEGSIVLRRKLSRGQVL